MIMPKSLTATIHIGFQYDEDKAGPLREGDVKILDRLMNRASDLSPELQELLVKFADHIAVVSPEVEGDGQSPGKN